MMAASISAILLGLVAALCITCGSVSAALLTIRPSTTLPPPGTAFRSLLCPFQLQLPILSFLGADGRLDLCKSDQAQSSAEQAKVQEKAKAASSFPSAHRSEDSTVFASAQKGEVTVADPYRWMEEPSSEQTRNWAASQAVFTDSYLEKCSQRAELRERLEANLNYSRYGTPIRAGNTTNEEGTYYYTYNSGLNAQPVTYQATRQELLKAEADNYSTPPGQAWFDQNLLSKNGTIALASTVFSQSGKYVAYGVSQSGSDWVTLYFRETSKPFAIPSTDGGEEESGGPDRLPDMLRYTKFASPTWTHDDKGVFYMRFPATPSSNASGTAGDVSATDTNTRAELYYHQLGMSQKEDILVIASDTMNTSSIWYPTVSDDGKWLLVVHKIDTSYTARTYAAPLDQPIGPDMRWIGLSPRFEYRLNYLASKGNDLYFVSNKDAPNDKVVRVRLDPTKAKRVSHVTDLAEEEMFEDIVEEGQPIGAIRVIDGNKLLLAYSHDVKDELWQFNLETGDKVGRLLPDFMGSINDIAGRTIDHEAYVSAVDFVNPGIVTRLAWQSDGSPNTGPSVTLHRTTKVSGIDPSHYETEQVFVTSTDGTKVPVFLIRHRDTKLDGTAPAWLYFYGGFGQSLRPDFSAPLMTWITAYSGVLVWVNARGGGEYGEAWHDAGRVLNKQHTFDDVLAVAQHLVAERIAAKGKIVVNGESNGGLGAMAVGNQAPEGLLGGIVAEVGIHDMLRFKYFAAGNYWASEYGDPTSNAVDFDYIYKYSPLHNVNASKVYPTTLLTTADHDDRVPPLHTFKMTAELQYRLPANPNPILVRVEPDAGHQAGKSTKKILEENVDKFCILATSLKLELLPTPAFVRSHLRKRAKHKGWGLAV